MVDILVTPTANVAGGHEGAEVGSCGHVWYAGVHMARLLAFSLAPALWAGAIAGCGHAGPPTPALPPPETVTLDCRPPAPGQTWTLVYAMGGTFRQIGQEGPREIRTRSDATVRLEVLAASKSEVTRARITWKEAVRRIAADGEETTEHEAVEGKSYVYERRDGALRVTRDDGTPVPAGESRALENEVIGDAPPVFRVLSGRKLGVGQTIALNDGELRQVRAERGPRVLRASLTFVRKSGALALFRSETELEGSAPDETLSSADNVTIDPAGCQLHEVKGTFSVPRATGKATMDVTIRRIGEP